MSDTSSGTCVIAVSFRLPSFEPHRWYSDKQLAILWRLTPGTLSVYRYRARRLGYGPHPDQYRVHKVNAARRYVEIRSDYAAILETVLPLVAKRPKIIRA